MRPRYYAEIVDRKVIVLFDDHLRSMDFPTVEMAEALVASLRPKTYVVCRVSDLEPISRPMPLITAEHFRDSQRRPENLVIEEAS